MVGTGADYMSDQLTADIRLADPRHPEVMAILSTHLQTMDDQAPGVPSTCQHALNVDGLCTPDIAFRAAWLGNEIAGVGALKSHGDGLSELKSMHTLAAFRGRGVGRALLEHLLAIARGRGDERVSLETGAQPGFATSREMYAKAGFEECQPFADYRPDPNSTFMTLKL